MKKHVYVQSIARTHNHPGPPRDVKTAGKITNSDRRIPAGYYLTYSQRLLENAEKQG